MGAACAVALATLFSGSAQAKPIAGVVRASSHGRPSIERAPRAQASNLPYNGGPVLHTNRTHLIFWQPSGSGLTFDPGYESLIEGFLQNVAADSHKPSNVYALTGQYGDGHGVAAYSSNYAGAVVASDRLPPNGCVEPPVIGPGWNVCLTDSQLQAEIEHVVRSDHLPTGRPDVYFLVTPNGLGSCTDQSSTECALGGSTNGYCAYHSQTTDGLVLYAVIPYNAVPGHCQSNNPRPNGSTADPALSNISHEHNEMVTDPVQDAWINSSGNEDGDLCMTSFGPAIGGSGQTAFNEQINGGHYYLQEEWSNADGGCRPRARPDAVSFRARPQSDRSGWISFSAHASAPHGSIVAYEWFFGHGTRGRGRTAAHRFRAPGRYRVVLRTTDSWDNWAFYAGTVTVPRVSTRRSAGAAKSG